ncbi:MAG TPA: hypothetical protein VHZ09_07790 [Acidobacteriaceae bacterium]|nr:hypothetical protein [Acidobacteriaceae bacterium]
MNANNALQKLRESQQELEAERRRMGAALDRLNKAQETRSLARRAGKLIFGLDLTGSRDAGIKQARIATAAMFEAIACFGRVEMKLVYYRGTDECRASQWCADADVLCRSMLTLSCETGYTQIGKLLRVALGERDRIEGVVFVGDHCEEQATEMHAVAALLRDRKIPLYIFHECADWDERSLQAKPVFKRMAEISGGVYVEFKPDSGEVLRELLPTIAAFSAAGVEGIARLALPRTPEARQLQGSLRLLLGSGQKR